MNESLQLRKAKAKARAEDKRALANGQGRKGEVCLAAAIPHSWVKSPLILDRVHLPEFENEDD